MKIVLNNIKDVEAYSCTPDEIRYAKDERKYILHGKNYLASIDKHDQDQVKINRVYDGCTSNTLRPIKAVYDFFSRAHSKDESCFKTRANQMTDLIKINNNKLETINNFRASIERDISDSGSDSGSDCEHKSLSSGQYHTPEKRPLSHSTDAPERKGRVKHQFSFQSANIFTEKSSETLAIALERLKVSYAQEPKSLFDL